MSSGGYEAVQDIQRGWQQQRYAEIRKLYSGGATRQELIDRFGAQNVSNALDKTFRYQ